MALRPELTPSLARMVISRGKSTPFPIKWFAIGQCWRYERMTRGRHREHYQWNMDILGVNEIDGEGELIAAIVHFFKSVGLTSEDVCIKYSSRRVLQAVLDGFGVHSSKFSAVAIIVDKLDKLPREAIIDEIMKQGITREVCSGIISALSPDVKLSDLSNTLPQCATSTLAIDDLITLNSIAMSYGIEDWLDFDASTVRGLSYYTGIVFEARDREGRFRAICGGGRYDKLLDTYGCKDPIPACGFGLGDAVICDILQEKGLLNVEPYVIDDVVFCAGNRATGAKVANSLRQEGRRVDFLLGKKSKKWAFKHAERVRARRLVLIDENGNTSTKELKIDNRTKC